MLKRSRHENIVREMATISSRKFSKRFFRIKYEILSKEICAETKPWGI